jgi:hypothetical protein
MKIIKNLNKTTTKMITTPHQRLESVVEDCATIFEAKKRLQDLYKTSNVDYDGYLRELWNNLAEFFKEKAYIRINGEIRTVYVKKGKIEDN